jgi:hypothetical protein
MKSCRLYSAAQREYRSTNACFASLRTSASGSDRIGQDAYDSEHWLGSARAAVHAGSVTRHFLIKLQHCRLAVSTPSFLYLWLPTMAIPQLRYLQCHCHPGEETLLATLLTLARRCTTHCSFSVCSPPLTATSTINAHSSSTNHALPPTSYLG